MAITAIASNETSDHFAKGTAPPNSLIAPDVTRNMELDALSVAGATTGGTGVTATTGNITATAGNLVFGAASAKIIPGATSLLIRNNGDSASNIIITDAGVVTLRSNIVFAAASAKILPGATSLLIRDTADGNSNIAILDSGATTVRGAITPTGGVAAAGGFTLAPHNIHTGNSPPLVSTDGADATPVATEFYWAQITIQANVSITGVAIFNGSVASGNVKVGLANSAGVVVATSASTAMSGTDAYQRVAFTGTYAAPGPATYYVLLFVDNNTARVNTHTFGNFITGKATGQVFATGFTTITPGTTFTTALGPMASLY